MVLAYELLQVSELVQILSGNFSSLSRNRQQIRRFIIENVFNDNCRPTDEGSFPNFVLLSDHFR